MTPYVVVVGVIGLVLYLVFLYSALRMLRDPGPPTPLDPETRAQLARMQMRGQRRGEAADGAPPHAPASRSEYEGSHPPVGGGDRAS